MSNDETRIVQQLPKLMSRNRKFRTAKRMRAKAVPEKVIHQRVWEKDPLAR